jgi:hypothetical protein
VPYCDGRGTELGDADANLDSLFSLVRMTFLCWQLEDRKERRCSKGLRRAIDRLHDPDLLRKEAIKSGSISLAILPVAMVK